MLFFKVKYRHIIRYVQNKNNTLMLKFVNSKTCIYKQTNIYIERYEIWSQRYYYYFYWM